MEDIDYGDKTCNSDESNQLLDELGRDLKKSNIIYYYNEEEEEEADGDITEELLVQMGYGKTKTKRFIEEDDYDYVIITGESSNQIAGPPKHEPPATPIPADNLKSAMKNSDRKEKSAGKERKVTWAEDVDVDVFDEIRVETETYTQRQNGRQQQWGENGKNKSGGGSRKKDKERKGGGKSKGKGKNFTGDGRSSKNVDFHSF